MQSEHADLDARIQQFRYSDAQRDDLLAVSLTVQQDLLDVPSLEAVRSYG